MNKIAVNSVSKTFGNVTALHDVTLDFEEKKIYGLLGRNGAGKSTLLNAITNRIFADSGTITVDGETAAENDRAQRKIYLMSEKSYYPETFKVSAVFKWTKEFYGGFDMEEAARLAELFKLNTNKKVSKLSTGYSSIFKIITALCVDVPYIFLDEPVLGLDANHRDLFYKLLLESYTENPRTFIISTHLIEEVSKIIEEIIIIKDGSIIENRTTEELLALGYTVTGPAAAVDAYAAGKQTIGEDVLGGLKNVYILGKLDRSRVPANLETSVLDLQKLFIQLTNS